MHNLKQQIKVMEVQLKDVDHIKSAYNSDKNAYTQALTGMKEQSDVWMVEYEKS